MRIEAVLIFLCMIVYFVGRVGWNKYIETSLPYTKRRQIVIYGISGFTVLFLGFGVIETLHLKVGATIEYILFFMIGSSWLLFGSLLPAYWKSRNKG